MLFLTERFSRFIVEFSCLVWNSEMNIFYYSIYFWTAYFIFIVLNKMFRQTNYTFDNDLYFFFFSLVLHLEYTRPAE